MKKEFHPTVSRRNFVGVGAFVFAVASICSLCLMFDARFSHRLFFFSVAAIGLCFAANCLLHACTYHRKCLVIDDGEIVINSGLKERRLKFGDVRSARWYVQSGGILTMRTRTDKYKIRLDMFSLQDSADLATELNRHLAEDIQYNWHKFWNAYPPLANAGKDVRKERIELPNNEHI